MRAKEELPECPVATAVSLIGGKWKLLILRNLKERPWRFNPSSESERSVLQPDIYPGGITQKYDQVVLAAVQGCARAANLPM